LADVFAQIEKDLSDAIPFLPSRKAQGFVNGRASKGAAQTLLAKVYLFQKKWDQVVTVTNDIITSQDYGLFPSYGGLFLEPNEYNQEVIFDITYIKDLYSNNIPQRYGAHYSPTLSLVEAYGFADGRLFNPDTDYQSGQPFLNRDPRLYENIWLPGYPTRGTGIISIPATANENPRRRTSLAIQKFINFSEQVIDNVGTNFIILRYADVLLMFAEAKNEVSGPGADVYHAVNQVRNRAGLPGLPGDLSKEDMRERIRQERRLEMAIEGWRFFDIKRWDIGDQTLNLHIMGYDRTKLISPDDPARWTFNRIIVEDRLWSSTAKHTYGYLFPIPGTEMDLNPNLIQNPGY
jgi:starch-binding outer membrane protein, SusD/RagB family